MNKDYERILNDALDEHENKILLINREDYSEEIALKVADYRKSLEDDYEAKRQEKIVEENHYVSAIKNLIERFSNMEDETV